MSINEWRDYVISRRRAPQEAAGVRATAGLFIVTCTLTGYILRVIVGFRHVGLKRLFERGDGRRILPELIPKVERVLARLDEASEPADMNLPGFRLHILRGDLAGFWSVSVSGNWRIVFRFEGRDVRDVNLLDYH